MRMTAQLELQQADGPMPRSGHAFRGVYLWAGQATVDLSREKFPDLAIDEEAHREAYSAKGARLLRGTGVNWAFVSMNWGFPPEIECEHWEEFERTVDNYHAAGLRVLGYVQSSNCVCTGSYATRDWYAVTPSGRRSPYYRRRLMTCWNHPEWIAEVETHALRAVASGADGVFFDNLWMGVTPWNLWGRVGGFAGCACARCSAAFEAATGQRVPRSLAHDERSAAYLRWRAGIVAWRLSDWAEAVRRQNSRALVLANNCDVVLRDTTRLFGLDLAAVGATQDALLVENVAMPRYRPGRRRLVANAVVIKAVQAAVPERLVLALPYEHGIGVDRLPSPLRARRAMAESLACGAATVWKGSEYLDSQRRVSVVTGRGCGALRDAAASVLRFAQVHPELFENLESDAEVAVLYDDEGMSARWSATAPETLAVAVALVSLAVPFRFASPKALSERPGALRLVLAPSGFEGDVSAPCPIVRLPEGLIDAPFAERNPRLTRVLLRLADHPMRLVARSYFSSAYVRQLLDRTGVAVRFLASPFFSVPRRASALRTLLPRLSAPHVVSNAPVLVERWQRPDGTRLVHLVNYHDVPARLRLDGLDHTQATLHTPDGGTRFLAQTGDLELECYAVLALRAPGTSTLGAGREPL